MNCKTFRHVEEGVEYLAHQRCDADGQPIGQLLKHPVTTEWVWTKCCGFIVKNGNVLVKPIAAKQPLLHPEELQRLFAPSVFAQVRAWYRG